MKSVFLIYCSLVVFVVQCNFAAEAASAFVLRLQTATLDTENLGREIAQEMSTVTPEQRKRLMAGMLLALEKAIATPEPRSDANNTVIMVAADVLKAVLDDDATLTAFGSSLNQLGPLLEPGGIAALSACNDAKAVEAMEKFARIRLKQFGKALPQLALLPPEQKEATDDIRISLLITLQGLAMSANNSGKVVARELRDEFVKLLNGSPYRDAVLKGLAKDIDPLLQKESQPPVPRDRVPAATSPSSSKNTRESKSETSLPLTQSSRVQGAPKVGMVVAAVIGSLIILGFFIWFLRKK